MIFPVFSGTLVAPLFILVDENRTRDAPGMANAKSE